MAWTDLFNVARHRSWGALPLAVLLWHGWYTARHLAPDYLLFVCYAANLLVGVGVILRSGMLTGAGFGWMVIACPLWLYDSIIHAEWEASCIAFHACGLAVGALSVIRYRLPKYTWLFAASVGLLLQLLARLMTNPSFNINASFRVYDGWETVFPDYRIYVASMIAGFSMVFLLVQYLNNRYVSAGEVRQ